jgi:hypothetical protein
MNRRDWVAVLIVGPLLAGLLGCTTPQIRSQAADESERDRYAVKTVGDVTDVGNAEPISVGGVGLVVDLDDTGGDCAHDSYRELLERHLKLEGVRKVQDVLSDPRNAMVIVTGKILPGTRKGDPIDLQVSLPPHSKATSLRGGYLRECMLFNYEAAHKLDPRYGGPNNLIMGNKLVKASGLVLVGLDGEENGTEKKGRISGGGKCLISPALTLKLHPDQQFVRIAGLVAERINQSFQSSASSGPEEALAKVRDNVAILLRVPSQYRFNLPRFLRVVRLVPLNEGVEAKAADETNPRTYRQRLSEDLLDPARTVTAALRLEALGERSIPALKKGLESQHPLVRFCSAEAIAYLGNTACADMLAEAAKNEPVFRAFALTALASLDEGISRVKLGELLATASADETRYGAFVALRAMRDEDVPGVKGEVLNDSFTLHRVAPDTEPLVHVTGTRRSEVVLFGKDAVLKPPFSFLAGDFTIAAGEYDGRCTISRIPLRGAKRQRQASLKLEDVLRTVADLGGSYPEVLDLLQQVHDCECLNCPVRCDALPRIVSVIELDNLGKGKDSEGTLVPAGQDLGALPTLFETGLPPRTPTGLRSDDRGPKNEGRERAPGTNRGGTPGSLE